MGFQLLTADGAVVLTYGAPPPPLPAPLPHPEPLPPLVEIECPKCGGLRYLEHNDPMLAERCDSCFGAQKIEVCSGCRELPGVVGGLEVCGCL